MIGAIAHALALTGSMTWEILWALILGFFLSAVVQAVVRKSTIVRLLGDDRPRTLSIAALLGAASSSCSYAAVALARSLIRKGANFTAAMAFEIGSTNLVVELGVILAPLMGWQFAGAPVAHRRVSTYQHPHLHTYRISLRSGRNPNPARQDESRRSGAENPYGSCGSGPHCGSWVQDG